MKTVRWSKPNERESAVHVVHKGSKTGGYTLACGAEIPIQEREDVARNPEPEPTCGNCQRALERSEEHAS